MREVDPSRNNVFSSLLTFGKFSKEKLDFHLEDGNDLVSKFNVGNVACDLSAKERKD